VEAAILPALAAGKIVLADRYLFTALARDAARGLEFDWLLHVYSPLLWPDLVLYLSMKPTESSQRIASMGAPRFYEAGQDVTGLDDPMASYEQFIHRVVTEYENLAVIFHFVKVDASDAVYRLHQRVRSLVVRAGKRPWPTFSAEAVAEWLNRRAPAGS
jgi:dTMP kinase